MIRIASAMLLMMLSMPAVLSAQSGKLDLRFEQLEKIASETVDVTLEGPMLQIASKFLSSEDADERRVKEMVSGISGIYVKSYEFKTVGAYSKSDFDKVRSQLGPEWQKIVTVKSHDDENVEIYVLPNGKSTRGIVIIAAEPKEFTVVQLLGTVDLDRLSDLEGEFGIPKIDVKVKSGQPTPKPSAKGE